MQARCTEKTYSVLSRHQLLMSDRGTGDCSRRSDVREREGDNGIRVAAVAVVRLIPLLSRPWSWQQLWPREGGLTVPATCTAGSDDKSSDDADAGRRQFASWLNSMCARLRARDRVSMSEVLYFFDQKFVACRAGQ
jgi:hypothetical protein